MNHTNHPASGAAALRRYRWGVASRAVAAAVGGYVLAAVATRLLSLLWPAPPAQAVMWATMLSFAIYAVAALWVFATRSAGRAWCGIIGVTVVMAVCVWWLQPGGGV